MQSENNTTEHNELDEPPSLSLTLEDSLNTACSGELLPVRPVKRPPSRILRKQFIFRATPAEWNDWQWQLKNRIQNYETLSTILTLSAEETDAIKTNGDNLPLSITPYYASLLDKTNPMHPLRRAVVPVRAELCRSFGEAEDPLGEDADSPVPGIVHRYPDRVLFLVTDFCSTYCRYCTRSRMVGRSSACHGGTSNWEKALNYIEANTGIRDVLLSGGDPLTLNDDALEWLLLRLCRIQHLEIVRIGTKVPVVLPQRITSRLARMLKRYHPLWINIHFMHPEEVTPETSTACTRLADAGIPLGSQTVLLKGINDDVDTMKELYHRLLKIRVRPYYLYQCDPIIGSGHFRTSVKKGLEIIKGLRGHTSGLAVPNFVIDAPGGGGKIPLLPEYVLGRYGDEILLKNYEDLIFRYPDSSLKRRFEEQVH
uniref:L-lysine 2,3-aminomutase n=1 Tax=uncultured Desulfobacterium sp. TaxID=201089 RepID=E1YF05_9BACT|nr:L-lysine 2,3-aminomutase [uncultured Desulfobacterium sp.]